jgi:hypothetical protein
LLDGFHDKIPEEENMKKILVPIIISLILTLLLPLHCPADSPEPMEANLMAVDPIGNTVFAYFNSGSRLLFKSNTSGLYDWTNTGLGTGLNGSSLVALAISPDYNDDKTLYAAASASLYKSTDGGETFSSLITLPHKGVTGNITSLAIGTGGKILVGTSTGAGGGGILLFDGEVWSDLEVGAKDVLAAAFSPNYAENHQVLACTYNGSLVQLENLVAGTAWNSNYPAASLYSDTDNPPLSADIAFPSNYDGIEISSILVGVNGQGSGPDLYRIILSSLESNRITDMDLNGAGTSCSVYSVAIAGTLGSGHIAVGLAGSNIVKCSAITVGSSSITWSDSTRPPDGTANVALTFKLVDIPDYYSLYAVTAGTGYGVFISYDFGDTFDLLLQPVNHFTPISDLAAGNETVNSVTLTWNLTEFVGEGEYYYMRYLESVPVTEDNWESAIQIDEPVHPEIEGIGRSVTVRGLQPGTTYYFAVKIGLGWSWSGISNSPHGTTLPVSDVQPPLAVDDLAVGGATYSSFNLTWTAPGDPPPFYGDWGGVPYPPDGSYDIPLAVQFYWPAHEGSDGDDFQLAKSMDFKTLIDSRTGLLESTWNETTVGLLDYGTTYSWRERPFYGEGYYPWVTSAFTTIPEISAHTGYDIRYSTVAINDDNWDSATPYAGPVPKAAGAAEVFTVANLRSSTTYYFALKTRDGANNWSRISNCASGTTRTIPSGGDYVPPAKITDLAVIETTSSSATLQWTATGDDIHAGTASFYDIRYLETNTLNADTWGSAIQVAGEPHPQPNGTKEKFTVKGLLPEVTYYFAIKAEDDANNWSLISNIADGTTLDTTPPAEITDLSVSESSTGSITLTWTATGDDGKIGTASQYDLRYTKEAGNQAYDTWTFVTGEPKPQASGSKEKCVVSSLASGTTYFFVIRASDEVPNWSPMSGRISGKTQDISSPPTPQPTPTSTPTPTPTGELPGEHFGDIGEMDPGKKPGVTNPQSPVGPVFTVTGLTVSKDKVSTGEAVKVTATIANTGDQTGAYTAQFLVNGIIEKKADAISLAPGSNDTVQFEFNKDAAGSYSLQVGEKASTVEVVKPIRAWIWILVAFAILLVILLILRQVLHWGFKKSKEE